MALRGRGLNQGNDWDPMPDDFDNSNYDPQYPDEESSGPVQLDHRRLYITNIPKGLNSEGLGAAFSKYGTVNEMFVNPDAAKRYGMVSYETPGEAKLAMMKLNRTEPLRLNISIAHRKTNRNDRERTGGDRPARYRDEDMNMRERGSRDGSSVEGRDRRDRDDASATSRGRKTRREDMANGDTNISMNDLTVNIDDDLGLDALDPEFQLELERLQLEHLKLQEQQVQCRQRMLIKQAEKRALAQAAPTNRQVQRVAGEKLKVVVRTDGPVADPRDGDSNYTAGAGDSRVGSRSCIACGAAAEAFCSRCGVTPYCSERCQRRDWADRHRAVCHNLARLSTAKDVTDCMDLETTPLAPLRLPRSPVSQKEQPFDKRDQGSGDQRGQGFASQRERFGNQHEKEASRNDEGMHKKLMPPGHNANVTGRGGNRPNNRYDNRNDSRSDNRNDSRNDNRSDNRNNNRSRPPLVHERSNHTNDNAERVSKGTGNRNNRTQDRRGHGRHLAAKDTRDDQNEDWGTPVQPVPETKPSLAEVTTPVKETPQPVKQPPQLVNQEIAPTVAPERQLVPKNCVVETLSAGEEVVLCVESAAGECRAAGGGYVCLSVHAALEPAYQALCDEYGVACERDDAPYTVTPGETFSYFNPEDSAWYRARCLAPALAALLDSAKVVALPAGARCKRLPDQFAAAPEFCCQLQVDGLQIGNRFRCTVLAKTASGVVVSMENIETRANAGKAELRRWLPAVEYPTPVPAAPAPLVLPEVPRPDVATNSAVFLVDATAYDRAFVRPAGTAAQKQFDAVLQDVVLYGLKASPLAEPPQKGQVVVGKFTDGLHYRALVKRTNVKLDKYLLEYIEYGNTHISKLEDLYPCPAELDLSGAPTVTSQVALQGRAAALTAPAVEYLDKLKDAPEELILTLPDGAKSAPSGCTVTLAVAKNKETVNRRLDEMCTPEWKQLEERGGDVITLKPIMFNELEYMELPAAGCTLEVLDVGTLQEGSVSAYQRGAAHAHHVLTTLTDQMAEYCNSEIGREPYLPTLEELCIAQCPPYPQWFRAAVADAPGGPGGPALSVCYFDYGNMETVPVALLRKMLPEFVRGLPALCNLIEINDFPKNPTVEQLQKALVHMEVTEEGRGVLHVTRCVQEARGIYRVDAPALIAAINSP